MIVDTWIEMDTLKTKQAVESIIGCAHKVYAQLGVGFLEKVYANAMAHEIRKIGLDVSQQYPIQVIYDESVVGDFAADLLVDDTVLVELETVRELDQYHIAQCRNYLKATGLSMCLLINFGPSRVQVKQIMQSSPQLFGHS
jgi:GxxExxY protein